MTCAEDRECRETQHRGVFWMRCGSSVLYLQATKNNPRALEGTGRMGSPGGLVAISKHLIDSFYKETESGYGIGHKIEQSYWATQVLAHSFYSFSFRFCGEFCSFWSPTIIEGVAIRSWKVLGEPGLRCNVGEPQPRCRKLFSLKIGGAVMALWFCLFVLLLLWSWKQLLVLGRMSCLSNIFPLDHFKIWQVWTNNDRVRAFSDKPTNYIQLPVYILSRVLFVIQTSCCVFPKLRSWFWPQVLFQLKTFSVNLAGETGTVNASAPVTKQR